MIADAHYSQQRPQLLSFLGAIASGAYETPQLILMGDVADLLIGPLRYTRRINTAFIETINRIAARGVAVVYLEGNHDFCLKGVFGPAVKVVPRAQQPLVFKSGSKRVALLHGDYLAGWAYELYCRFIRSRTGLMLTHYLSLNFLNNRFLRQMEQKLQQKKLCHDLSGFAARRAGLIQRVAPQADIILEGHFHQGVRMKKEAFEYLNLPAFACGQSFVVVQSDQNGVLFDQREWGHS